MEEVRGELREILREARVLLGRERSRGRVRVGLMPESPSQAPPASAPAPLAASGPAPAYTAGPAPTVWMGETLALPGFESLAPSAPASAPAGRPLALRDDLPVELPALAQQVAACRRCRLCETRTQTVFGDGSPTARLLFIGEAPGRDEDAQGIPFVGRAGQLLNRMIAAIDLKREEVYICNVLKCRPPENRVPAPEEVEQCRPYLEQQIALIRPSLICALGLSAAQALLQTKASMGSMRGGVFHYRGIPVIPTYHPAALLRNPSLKREAWIDLQRVRDRLRDRTAA